MTVSDFWCYKLVILEVKNSTERSRAERKINHTSCASREDKNKQHHRTDIIISLTSEQPQTPNINLACHQTTCQCKALCRPYCLLSESLGIPGGCSLPAPPHYQNHDAVLDIFNPAFGGVRDGNI
jgi:hypothetical protein